MGSKILGLLTLVLLCGSGARGQVPAPVISGGAGFLGTNQGGANLFQPVIAPVLAAPLGDRWLLESRADLREVIVQPSGTGPYQTRFFPTLEYAQLDYNAASWLTIVVGRFLIPFNIYNERFSPIWIRDLADPPIIVPIGTRTNGYADGGMLRGSLVSRKNYQVYYTAYFSSLSTVNKLESGRSTGVRAGVFFPQARFELGFSYQRLLQDERRNSFGAYLSWQPYRLPLAIRGEYAHSPGGHGYWLEGTYRFSRYRGPDSLLGRLQAVGRAQQFFRLKPGSGDSLPQTDARRVDFGWNYYLPHEVRLNASYGRQFAPSGNFNAWNFGVTYRFLFPLFPGGKR